MNLHSASVPASEKKIIIEEHVAFRYSAFFLNFIGLWTQNGQKPNTFAIIRGYFGALVVVAIFGYQFTLLNQELSGEIIAEFIAEFLAAKTAICKVLPIILNRKNIFKIWQKTYEINAISKKTLVEKEIVEGWLHFQFKIVKLFICFAIASLAIYQIAPWINGSKFPIKGVLPEWAKTSPWFYPVYTIITAMSVLRCITVSACDICCIIVICQLLCQLQLVQHLINELGENNTQALQNIIARHIMALDYGRMICDNFTLTFMLQHYDIAMSICFLGAVALYTNEFALLTNLIFFIVSYVSELAIICYTGEKLTIECSKITSNIENTYNKFISDVRSLKLMHIMLMRAQEPLKFNFGSARLGMNYYSQTINTIYSFFMVLKSMIE